MTDLIGDIHGHADKLEALLQKMGYALKNGAYAHPERKVLFIGDYIDRGPKIRKTLEIVKSMVDSDNAIALMGNHEYNAICFQFRETTGGHVRPHLIKNIIQHYKTLSQFKNRQAEYDAYIQWFLSLPLYFESDSLRAVHACWDNADIALLRKSLVNDCLTEDLIRLSVEKTNPLYSAVEQTLKGREIMLPPGVSFKDKDKHERTEIRIKWWEEPTAMTYRSISVEPIEGLTDDKVQLTDLSTSAYYLPESKPVFFGHYWLKGQPSLYRNNICCLDYSVANKGLLVAYRHDGKSQLDNSKFVYV